MTTHILAAGDHFVLPQLLSDAVRSEVGPDVQLRELTLPWPEVPFGRVAEVDEASGTEADLIEALAGISVCVTQMAPLTEAILAASPELKLFCIGRGGPVNANLSAASEHGVAVSYAPGRNATATAEHTVALMLAACRQIPATHLDLMNGLWRGDYYRYDQVGLELSGRTVGLVGYGAIGRRVAGIVAAFGAHPIVYDPYIAPETLAGIAEPVELNELIGRSDVVTLHARLNLDTVGLVDAALIRAMRPGAVLVNCARGGMVDYDAVCDALETGQLFAAAFDVFDVEPLPADSRLRTTRGVVMTPHLAGASKETAHNAAAIVAGEVGRYLRGEPLRHCANPDVLVASLQR